MYRWNGWKIVNEFTRDGISDCTHRLKVEGGSLFRTVISKGDVITSSMCFIADNTMEVFAHHIKEAFNQGYESGKKDALSNANNTAASV